MVPNEVLGILNFLHGCSTENLLIIALHSLLHDLRLHFLLNQEPSNVALNFLKLTVFLNFRTLSFQHLRLSQRNGFKRLSFLEFDLSQKLNSLFRQKGPPMSLDDDR